MELELRKEHFSAYQSLPQLYDMHEETAETIVPDYCPDISRIVESSGCLNIRQKDFSDGKLYISGSTRMTVLYLGENDSTLRSLDYIVPLDYSIETHLRENFEGACVSGRITASEVRLLNPRKLMTTLYIEVSITAYEKVNLISCSAVEQQDEYKIETLCEQHDYMLIQALQQKDFSFCEEIALPGSREPIRELLKINTQVRVNECKAISNKLILKGTACYDALYITESGTLARLGGDVLFSQIIEGMEDNGKDVICDCILSIADSEYRIGSDSAPNDTRSFTMKLFLSAFVTLRQRKEICCIADLYSTGYDLKSETKNVQLIEAEEILQREQNIRIAVETGCEVSNVLSASVLFGSISAVQNADHTVLQTSADVSVLYLDENGTPLLTQRRSEISLEAALPQVSRVSIRSVCAGEISAVPAGVGIEVRFPVVFTVAAAATPCYPCLMSLEMENNEENRENLPSLILKALAPGQKLWDLAKQYHTTVRDIMAANELIEETAAAVGQLLLIPRRR